MCIFFFSSDVRLTCTTSSTGVLCFYLQNFLCYSCKEYVEDLSKIPEEVLEVSFESPQTNRSMQI